MHKLQENQYNSVRALIGYDPFGEGRSRLSESNLSNLIFESTETLDAVREIGEHVKNSSIALSKLTTAFNEFQTTRGSSELDPLLDHFEAVKNELQNINTRARNLTDPDGFWSKLVNFFSNSTKKEINKAAAIPLYINALVGQLKNSLEQTFHTLEGAPTAGTNQLKATYERQLNKFLRDNKKNINNISKNFEVDVDFDVTSISQALAKCVDNNLAAAGRFRNFKNKFNKLLSRLGEIASGPTPQAPAGGDDQDQDSSPPDGSPTGTPPGGSSGGEAGGSGSPGGGRGGEVSGGEDLEILIRRPRARRIIDLYSDDIISIIDRYRSHGMPPISPPVSPPVSPPGTSSVSPTPPTNSKIKRSNLKKILTRNGVTPEEADRILVKIIQSVKDQLRNQGLAPDAVLIESYRLGGLDGLSLLLSEIANSNEKKRLLSESRSSIHSQLESVFRDFQRLAYNNNDLKNKIDDFYNNKIKPMYETSPIAIRALEYTLSTLSSLAFDLKSVYGRPNFLSLDSSAIFNEIKQSGMPAGTITFDNTLRQDLADAIFIARDTSTSKPNFISSGSAISNRIQRNIDNNIIPNISRLASPPPSPSPSPAPAPGPTPTPAPAPGSPSADAKIKTNNFKRFVSHESPSANVDAVVAAIKQSFTDQLKNQGNSNIIVERKTHDLEETIENNLFDDWNKLAGLKQND